jgi:hypothetical protein
MKILHIEEEWINYTKKMVESDPFWLKCNEFNKNHIIRVKEWCNESYLVPIQAQIQSRIFTASTHTNICIGI